MKKVFYVIVFAALIIIPWLYSQHKDKKAVSSIEAIQNLYDEGKLEEALSFADEVSALHRNDRQTLLKIAELETSINRSLYEVKLDSIEMERQLLIREKDKNASMIDSINSEKRFYVDAIREIDRQQSEAAAACQCVTVMKNVRYK